MMLFGPPNFANGNPGPFPCGGGPCIPIDQGAVFLICVGMFLGIYLLYYEHKE